MAALSSNQMAGQGRQSSTSASPVQPAHNRNASQGLTKDTGGHNGLYDSPGQSAPGSERLGYRADDSPYLDFDLDAKGDDAFDFGVDGQMIGDIPDSHNNGDLHDKRKSIDGNDDDDEGGGKRRESEDKSGKKPGRKPLTSEPTSVSALRMTLRAISLTNVAETESSKSGCSAGLPRTKGEASQRPRDEGGRFRKGLRICQP